MRKEPFVFFLLWVASLGCIIAQRSNISNDQAYARPGVPGTGKSKGISLTFGNSPFISQASNGNTVGSTYSKMSLKMNVPLILKPKLPPSQSNTFSKNQ